MRCSDRYQGDGEVAGLAGKLEESIAENFQEPEGDDRGYGKG